VQKWTRYQLRRRWLSKVVKVFTAANTGALPKGDNFGKARVVPEIGAAAGGEGVEKNKVSSYILLSSKPPRRTALTPGLAAWRRRSRCLLACTTSGGAASSSGA
jgi:hypothetical protein